MSRADPTLERIEPMVEALLAASPEERPALLDRFCGDDTTLRHALTAFVEDCERADAEGFLDDDAPLRAVPVPAWVGALFAGDELETGTLVDGYRVVRALGRGGMGAVYLAERADGRFDKQVALKVIKRGMDSREILHRFGYECRILARLEHPHIARLYDAGTLPDGRPYFVLEYVEGLRLDHYCDAHRLGVRARLDLFAQVCAAVAFAHSNLVVHRDLKPSNILVAEDEEGRPQVKLLDFGIAKLLEEDPAMGTMMLTQTG
ncbi:MAG: serine/threonine-protein kinase, partial [Rhodothermales bacterium]|nr:serine/threonine-protein kinase [Rhodothermales bacterium]